MDLANIDKVELSNRIKDLEKLESEKEHASSVEKELRAKITQLENDLFDKNKVIDIDLYLSHLNINIRLIIAQKDNCWR